MPLLVAPPSEPGRYLLALDLVHEGERWLGCTAEVPVTIEGAATTLTPALAPQAARVICVTGMHRSGTSLVARIVNVLGSFLMGFLAGYFAYRTGIPQHLRLFLTTGILGGFTTFSAFSLDAALLMERHAYWSATAYILGSVILSLVALFAGLSLFRIGAPLP